MPSLTTLLLLTGAAAVLGSLTAILGWVWLLWRTRPRRHASPRAPSGHRSTALRKAQIHEGRL